MRSISAIIAAATQKVMQTSAYRFTCKEQQALARLGLVVYVCAFVNEKPCD